MGSEIEQELDDRWWPGLRDRVMESVDAHQFSAVVSFGSGSALTIESDAHLRIAPGQPATPAVTLNQDGTVAVSEILMSLNGQRVLSGVAFKTGALRLVFESGALIAIPFAELYEAWQLTGPSGRTWVSLPGGGLATFPAAPA